MSGDELFPVLDALDADRQRVSGNYPGLRRHVSDHERNRDDVEDGIPKHRLAHRDMQEQHTECEDGHVRKDKAKSNPFCPCA